MKLQSVLRPASWHWTKLLSFALALVLGGILAASESPVAATAAAACVLLYLLFAAASVREPILFVTVFLLVLEVFPPLYFSRLGETPFFLSFLLLPIAFAIVVLRLPDIRFRWDALAIGLALFLGGIALSLPFAWWLSGTEAAMASLSRWVLISQAALIYYLIRGAARLEPTWAERQILRLLLIGAVLSATYGIVDFIWPLPVPHPAADQFIWLEGLILRRAQGVFYESSNFANFCGIFLVTAATAYLARRERYVGVPRTILMVFISILGLAVLVGFSRSTWASISTALIASVLLSRFVKVRRAVIVFLALSVPFFLLWMFSPDLWSYLVSARLGRLFDIFNDPNFVTSGRFETWRRVLSIMRDEPQYLIFGIGYKTLTVTRLFHGEIITDNGYLSLLLETGIAGLAGFLIWSAAILTTFFRLARSASEVAAFWATVLFSIWCGEMVQMLATDAQTYWRNIVVLTALMALTLNRAERDEPSRMPT